MVVGLRGGGEVGGMKKRIDRYQFVLMARLALVLGGNEVHASLEWRLMNDMLSLCRRFQWFRDLEFKG